MIVLIGLIIFATSLICKYFHDDYKNFPNLFVGYKTKYAMKDEFTWKEANSYFYKIGISTFTFSIVFTILTKLITFAIPDVIKSIIVILIVATPVIATEIHLRKYNKNYRKSR